MSIKEKDLNSKVRLSIDQKIELFKEYKKEVGEDITGATVYKGFKIGTLAIMIRNSLKKGIVKLSKEQEEELEKLGILEPQGPVDTLDAKIKRLCAFSKKHSEIWRNRNMAKRLILDIEDVKKRKKINDEFEDAENCYRYLYVRNRGNYLTQKQLKKLIDSGVGGVFGLPKESEEDKQNVMRKFGIEEKTLNFIIKKYGSIEAFRKLYIESLIQRKVKENIPEEILENCNLVYCFDLSKPDFISRKDEYVEFLKDALDIQNEGIIITGEGLKNSVEDSLKKINPQYSEIVHKIYGLNGESKKTFRSIALEYDVTPQALSLRKIGGIRTLKKYESNISKNIYELDDITRENFIRTYFSKHDIFYGEKAEKLDTQTIGDLLNIIIAPTILSKINFHNDDKSKDENMDNLTEKFYQYISKYEQLELEINEAYLDEKIRIALLELIAREKNSPKFQIKQQKIILSAITQIMNSKSQVYDFPIENLENLSVRAMNCLLREDICTVGQWLELSEEEKIQIKKLGVKTKEEIDEKVTFFRENFTNIKRAKIIKMINDSYLHDEEKSNLFMILYKAYDMDSEQNEETEEQGSKKKISESNNADTEHFNKNGENKTDKDIDSELEGAIENLKQAYLELENQIRFLQQRKLNLQEQINQIELRKISLRQDIDSLSEIVQRQYKSINSVPIIKNFSERLKELRLNLEIEKRKKEQTEAKKAIIETKEEDLKERRRQIKEKIEDIEFGN